RDFEIFVSLPRQLRPGSNCAAVIALDANSTWSCVSEIATRMARAGEIDDVITVGIGTPRTEGDVAFGLRRFEELSPPAGEVAFQGDLGRFFLSIFATFGLDARKHFGLAPLFHRFLSEELLPMLLRTLPIDPARLCLVGHSAAGTYAAYEIAQPDSLFAGVAVLSPGVRISDDWMLKADGGLGGIAHRKQVFVAIGGAERDNAFNKLAGIPLSERYADALRQQGAGDNIDYACLDGETHTTAFARAYALFLARRFARTEEETI
ncbi:MAG TPA: alpha/beta hydrolase-fold protein, partial [Solimonas sp.]|nr:alpha/beta hydrolase-fold protein [Solimonas sp.]